MLHRIDPGDGCKTAVELRPFGADFLTTNSRYR